MRFDSAQTTAVTAAALLVPTVSDRPACRRPGRSGVGLPDRYLGIGRSAVFDRDLEVVVLMLNQLHRGVESADAHDAIPVADITVVEHQVARGCVVADITDVWVGSCWCAVRRQPPRKCRNLLDVVEVFEDQGKRQ